MAPSTRSTRSVSCRATSCWSKQATSFPPTGGIVSSASLEVQEAALTGESRADREGQHHARRRGATTRRSHQHRVPEHPGHSRFGRARRHRHRPVDPDGPDRRHGHGDEAIEVAAAEGARRPDQDLRIPRLGCRRDHRDRRHRTRPGPRDARCCCASRQRSPSIPTGLPTFVQTMLSSGAQRLAESKAVVKSLDDVETLGGTTVINSDKTGTLTMNAMTSVTMMTGGPGTRSRAPATPRPARSSAPAGDRLPDFTGLALGLALCSDATVADDESIIGDPTEAALVVLAAKIGVDAEETRRAIPRIALEVPFDSEYKFMATFHDRPAAHGPDGCSTEPHFMTVKGAPDVVLDRCSQALWHGERRADRPGSPGDCSTPTNSCRRRGCACLPSPLASSTTTDAPRPDDPMGEVARPGHGRPGRHHRSAATVGDRRGAHRARRRHRRPHDHRRPHGHRQGDRRSAGPRPRRDHRRRPAEAERRRGDRRNCPSCTCSAGSHPRTRCASRA